MNVHLYQDNTVLAFARVTTSNAEMLLLHSIAGWLASPFGGHPYGIDPPSIQDSVFFNRVYDTMLEIAEQTSKKVQKQVTCRLSTVMADRPYSDTWPDEGRTNLEKAPNIRVDALCFPPNRPRELYYSWQWWNVGSDQGNSGSPKFSIWQQPYNGRLSEAQIDPALRRSFTLPDLGDFEVNKAQKAYDGAAECKEVHCGGSWQRVFLDRGYEHWPDGAMGIDYRFTVSVWSHNQCRASVRSPMEGEEKAQVRCSR